MMPPPSFAIMNGIARINGENTIASNTDPTTSTRRFAAPFSETLGVGASLNCTAGSPKECSSRPGARVASMATSASDASANLDGVRSSIMATRCGRADIALSPAIRRELGSLTGRVDNSSLLRTLLLADVARGRHDFPSSLFLLANALRTLELTCEHAKVRDGR